MLKNSLANNMGSPREWLHLTFDDYAKLKGSNIDRFNSFPTEVCEME